MRRPLAALALVGSGFLIPLRAVAQGEDARPVRPGTMRIAIAPDWSRWDHRFGRGTPGLPDGSTEPLAVDFSSDALGTAQLPALLADEARLRALTGLPNYDLRLGRARLTLNASWRTIPIGLELGISRRLTVGVAVPIVRARMEAFLLGPDTGVATRGNVGLNPALLSPGAFDAFRAEVDTALRALMDQAANGPLALRAQAQATLLALQPFLCGLYLIGGGNAAGPVSPCFDPAATRAALLPAAGTAAAESLATILGRARTSYEQLRALYAGQGVTLPPLVAAYALPATPLDSVALRQLFLHPDGPFAGDSLTTVVRTRLGDIETAAWFQLADRPRWRSQLSVLVRWPTGTVDSPHNFIDLGTGDRQLDVEIGWRNDFVLSPQLWVHAGGRYGSQFAHDLERRVAPATELLPAVTRLALVRRDPGDYVAVDVVPRWHLDDAFSVGVAYRYYRRGVTRHRYLDPADEIRVGLPAGLLDEETGVVQTQVGAGLTFSTVERHARGLARIPYSVTAAFRKTFAGSGGRVPDAEAFHLDLRLYLRIRE